MLKTLEDNLLSRLSAASGNFLDDNELVENLEVTKHTADEIEEKVAYSSHTALLIFFLLHLFISSFKSDFIIF